MRIKLVLNFRLYSGFNEVVVAGLRLVTRSFDAKSFGNFSRISAL